MDDYYIRQLASGYDEVVFNISIWDPLYPDLVEETSIRDRDKQWYLIKQIDGGSSTAKIVAQLDLDAWKADMLIGYSNGSATLFATLQQVKPTGWSIIDNVSSSVQRTIEGDYTPLEVLEQCRDTYGVYFKFDNVAQTVTVVIPDAAAPLGAFATRDLNLKEINYKGKSNDIVTRLYAYGKDGLSFASINNGLPYVDNFTYTDRVICGVWKDDRYTVAENLLADAKETLAVSCIPSRSYDCDVVDLRATNPEMYGFQNFDVFSVATLIDDAKNFAIDYQIVERWEYPYYPEKNKVIFSESPSKIQSQVTHITQQIENPNSGFQQQIQAAIGNATNWITNGKGYMVAVVDDEQNWIELCSLDTKDISTAANVWRWNNGGFGHSSSGYNGPYTTAITQDGAIVASFITVGTLTAIRIQAENGDSYWDLNGGEAVFNSNSIVINSSNFQLDASGNVTAGGVFSSNNGVTGPGRNVSQLTSGGLYLYRTTPDGQNRQAMSIYGYGANASFGYIDIYGSLSGNTQGIIAQIYGDYDGSHMSLRNGSSHGTITFNGGTGSAEFEGNVDIQGSVGLGVTTTVSCQNLNCWGDKNRIVPTIVGNVKMAAFETPEPSFADSGSAQLDENGLCLLELDPVYAETVEQKKAPRWLITPTSEGTAWVEKRGTCAMVHGTPGLTFDWMCIGAQRGYADVYAERCYDLQPAVTPDAEKQFDFLGRLDSENQKQTDNLLDGYDWEAFTDALLAQKG